MGEGMFKAAAKFAGSYKQHHPEAVGLMTRIETLAYKPKPAGYPQFIDGIIRRLAFRGRQLQANRLLYRVSATGSGV